jgi:pSer/pThr/pTyr-binding forkhead associated (FHA) protein
MSYSETPGPELLIQHTGQAFPLGEDTITIGAAKDNLIILADPEVSPHHATITWQAEENSYVIADLGGEGGTFVNERRVEGEAQLRHGDVLRLGNTIIDVRLEQDDSDYGLAPVPIPPEEGNWISQNPILVGVGVVVLAAITIACCTLLFGLAFGGGDGRLEVTIQSPSDGTQIWAGDQLMLQSTASGRDDIVILEMAVESSLVASVTSPNPGGESSLSINKPWTISVPGEYTISAAARTVDGKESATDSVQVVVLAGSGQRPTTTPTPQSGQPTDTPAAQATPTPTPETTEVPPPQIEFFQANPAAINAGECTTLQWGTVSNATDASIEPDVGGIGTPGRTTVCPEETTTYVLTAQGPGGANEASTTVTVASALADLVIDSVLFDPNPAVVDQETVVTIAIRNAGAGAAGAFDWEWRAGAESRFDGRLRGLNAGESTVVTVRWTPASPYARLDTVARVDINNEVDESNEDNNETWATVQVVEGDQGGTQTVTLISESDLDGYLANDGRGSNRKGILAGNTEISESAGEVVWRGFLSFDLSTIPNSVTIDNVELRFFQARVGGDPYGKLGSLVLDQVDFGSSLDQSAYNAPAINSAVLAQQTQPGTWYVLSSPLFTSWLEQKLAEGGSRIQFRLQFQQETDGDGKEDYVSIESTDNFLGSGNEPELIVTYTR